MLFSALNGSLDLSTAIIEVLACLLVIIVILPFHEWAHGFAAYKLGDITAKMTGRLKFNPLAHVDPFGAICLLLFNFGWAKPVPVNPRNFTKIKNQKLGMAIVALAGPLANIAAALAGGLILNLIKFLDPVGYIYTMYGSIQGITGILVLFLIQYIAINASLAVFNLIPIPPLDGSKILFTFLPDRIVYNMYKYQMAFFILIYVLLFTGILTGPLAFLQNHLYNFILYITSLPFLPFL